MDAIAKGRDRVDEYVSRGVRGFWVPVAKSVQVKGDAPTARRIMGENLVMWRDKAGKVHCVEDFCPHRGAKLSLGMVQKDGHVACRYHGVAVDGTGTVASVPAMPDCALEGRKALQAYETAECADAIFIYMPSADRPDAPPFEPPVELAGDDWATMLCMTRWDCNYRFALDNAGDPMHASYLHADSFTLAYGAKQDTMKLERTEKGFKIERVGQQGVNLDWTEVVMDEGITYYRLDIPYPDGAGPGGPFRIVGMSVAIDEHQSHNFFWRCRQVTGLERESWRFLYRAFLEDRHWFVLEQDREMLESIPDDARRREMLYQHDIGVSRMRQMLVRRAKEHFKALDAAEADGAKIA